MQLLPESAPGAASSCSRNGSKQARLHINAVAGPADEAYDMPHLSGDSVKHRTVQNGLIRHAHDKTHPRTQPQQLTVSHQPDTEHAVCRCSQLMSQ